MHERHVSKTGSVTAGTSHLQWQIISTVPLMIKAIASSCDEMPLRLHTHGCLDDWLQSQMPHCRSVFCSGLEESIQQRDHTKICSRLCWGPFCKENMYAYTFRSFMRACNMISFIQPCIHCSLLSQTFMQASKHTGAVSDYKNVECHYLVALLVDSPAVLQQQFPSTP